MEGFAISNCRDTLCCEFERINDDVMLHIFSYLSFKNRVILERVCKRWHNILMKSYGDVTSISLAKSSPSLTKLSDECVDTFFKRLSQSLVELNLDTPYRYLSENFLKAIRLNCRKVNSLSMKRVSVPMEELQKCLSSFTHLKNLSLTNVKADGMTCKGYEEIFSSMPTLVDLTIRDQLFINGHLLQKLPKNISRLSLGPYYFDENSMRILVNDCPQLNYLNMEGCTVHLNDMKSFCERSRSLSYLNISNMSFKYNQQDSQADHNLIFIGLLRNLEELHACGTTISDDALKILSLNCTRLRILCLKTVHFVTDVGMVHLSNLKNLQILDLSNNSNINDWSVGHIVSKNRNLQKIYVCNSKNLRGTFISLAMSNCHELEFISFCNCSNVKDDILNDSSTYFFSSNAETKVFKINIHKTNVTIANVFANENLQSLRLDFDDTSCDEHHDCCPSFDYNYFS